ncbi:MAG: hypothetical protein K2O88_02425, partial [Paramuribaculum sp.]|nr:hypothetical protein [Paramuribaculum sp.]
DITMVVNYDVPHDAEDYVHRIGRTARADADGEAITFVSERERAKFAAIERFLDKKVRRQQIPETLGKGPTETSHSCGNNKSKGKKFSKNHTNRHKSKPSDHQRNGNSTKNATTNTPSASTKPHKPRSWHRNKKRPSSDKPTTSSGE